MDLKFAQIKKEGEGREHQHIYNVRFLIYLQKQKDLE